MVIRIPDFLFAQSGGEMPPPGELDAGASSAVAAARSAEKEITSLNRGLGLASEALRGGEKAEKQLAAARDALGRRGDGGALRWLLDHVATQRAGQEVAASHGKAMRTLVGTIRAVGSLPIPFSRKAEIGRAVLRQGVEQGLVAPPDHDLFESALYSDYLLRQAQGEMAKASKPGEALAIAAAAKGEGALLEIDSELLDRSAQERDAVATVRHNAGLAWKEQDDLAAFARGELPEPLGEESFRAIHGARDAPGAHARYQAARREGEALALIRGRDEGAIEAAKAAWQGDPAVFAEAQRRDAAERRRDPAGYALATVPGASAAMEETPEAERGALLWAAQAAAGIPEDQRSPWTLAEEEAMADAWAALPSGSAGRNEKLAFLQKHLQGVPPLLLRDSAIGRMVRQGIVDGTKAELSGVVASLDDGRFNASRRLASSIQVAELTTGEQHADSGQIADDSSDLPQVAQGSDATEHAEPERQGRRTIIRFPMSQERSKLCGSIR